MHVCGDGARRRHGRAAHDGQDRIARARCALHGRVGYRNEAHHAGRVRNQHKDERRVAVVRASEKARDAWRLGCTSEKDRGYFKSLLSLFTPERAPGQLRMNGWCV